MPGRDLYLIAGTFDPVNDVLFNVVKTNRKRFILNGWKWNWRSEVRVLSGY